MHKHLLSILIAAALLLTLAACGKDATTTAAAAAQPNSSYTGTVSAVSTNSVTVTTDSGDITIALTDATVFSYEFAMGGQDPGNMDGMPGEMGQVPGGMDATPPEIPEDGSGMIDGTLSGDIQEETFPQMPEDGMGGMDGGFGGMGGQMPELTVANISVGSTVTVQTDETGKAASVTISGNEMGMQRPGGMGTGGDIGAPGDIPSGPDGTVPPAGDN